MKFPGLFAAALFAASSLASADSASIPAEVDRAYVAVGNKLVPEVLAQ